MTRPTLARHRHNNSIRDGNRIEPTRHAFSWFGAVLVRLKSDEMTVDGRAISRDNCHENRALLPTRFHRATLHPPEPR